MSSTSPKKFDFSHRWEEASEFFIRLIALAPEDRRTALDAIGDPLLRENVKTLLASHESAPDFLEKPVLRVADVKTLSDALPFDLPLGETIGDFELLEVIGRGGFATVYKAKQKSLSRIVALKITENMGTEARTVA